MPGIVSLLPSATEWVCALGLDADLRGVTFECDHPRGVARGRAVVVQGLPTAGLEPGAIDALVRERLAAGEPLYTLDTAALAAIAPDVVLTQDLCAVCALPADAAREACAAVGDPTTVVTLDPHTLAEVLDGATAVADACGVVARGELLRRDLQGRLDAVEDAVRGRDRPRVLVLEWTDPPFVAGHWVPDLVAAAGAQPVLAAPGARSTATTWDDVARAGADAVLVAPCGYGLADARRQAAAVLDQLPAGTAVWAIDAGAVVTRPGPRVVDAVEALAAAWHPGAGAGRLDLVALVRPGGGDTTTTGMPDVIAYAPPT
ncbi:MAG TPA: ABC transporter substrate-binding protein [Kineosporiaceae bacterium]|nr:ABC transporter substrate-binding protein [Kineosporiaceae bacterium]